MSHALHRLEQFTGNTATTTRRIRLLLAVDRTTGRNPSRSVNNQTLIEHFNGELSLSRISEHLHALHNDLLVVYRRGPLGTCETFLTTKGIALLEAMGLSQP